MNFFLSLMILLTLWKWYVFLFSLVLHSALVVSSWRKRCNPRKEIYERRSDSRESIRNASYIVPWSPCCHACIQQLVSASFVSTFSLTLWIPRITFWASFLLTSQLILFSKEFRHCKATLFQHTLFQHTHTHTHTHTCFPSGSDSKEPTCSAADLSSIPGSGRSPQEENGHPLQYSCLENSMDRRAWWATVHGAAKSQTQPSN